MRLALLTPAMGSRNVGDALIEEAVCRLVPAQSLQRLTLRRPLTPEEMRQLNDCDAAILCGSNLYQEHWGCGFLTPEFLHELKIPLIPLGIGCSAAAGESPRVAADKLPLLREMHRRSRIGSVRDAATQRWLQGIGIDNVRLTGCPVLFHALRRPEFHRINPEAPVALSLRRDFLHGAECLERLQWPILDPLCRQLQPTLVSQGPADDAQALALARRHDLQVFNHWQDGATESYEWLARHQSWSLNLRLHFGMLSLSHGKPSWWIGQDSRVEGFCQLMGLPWRHIRDWQTGMLKEMGPGHEAQFADVPQRWDQLAATMREVLAANGLPCALDLPAPKPKPRVLFLVPRRQWAYDFSAQSLASRLSPEFDIRIRYSTDRPALRPEAYDLAQVFYWGEDAHLGRGFDPAKVLMGCSSHRWQHPGKHGPLSSLDFAQRHLQGAATVLTTSLRLQRLIRPAHPSVQHAPNGYEPSLFFSESARRGPLRIGAAGFRKDPVKGYDDILIPAAKGMDMELAEGSMSHGQMNDFYNRFDVIAITSQHEGEPLTLMEAMAAGCFPVCSDVGIVPELVRHLDNGYIVPHWSVEAFRAAFQWCAEHLDRVREAGQRNAAMMPGLRSWDLLCDLHRNHLRQALSESTGARIALCSRLEPSHPQRQRLARLLGRLGLSWSPATARDAEAPDLSDEWRRCSIMGLPWRPALRLRYRLGLNHNGPHGLEWEELEQLLRQGLLPRPPSPQNPLARLQRRIQRQWQNLFD